MSGNEEADAAAGTPDEGKKLTFAERRELERKKKEEEARDAGERPSGALGRGRGGFDRVKREEETRGRDDGSRGDRSRSRSGSRERKKHRKHRRHRSTSHSSDDSDSRSRSRDRKSHRKERRSDKKRRHDRSRSRSREGRRRSGDGGQGTAVSDAQLAQNPALAAMAAMVARDQVKAAWGVGAASNGQSDPHPDSRRTRPSRFSDAIDVPPPPPMQAAAGGGGEQGRSDLQSNIEAMRKIAEMAASVSAKAASAAGVSGWDQPPTGPPGPYAGAAQGGGGGMPFSGGGAEVTHTFDPRFEGKIIGRQGSVINELQTIHGVKLQVEKGRGILLMLGTPDAIARCKADIDAICVDDRAGGPVLGQGVPGWLNEVVHIGAQNEGRVIGSGGSVIRDLEARTGCSVKVQKGEGTCTIGGVDPEKVAAAKAEVQRICEASGNPVGGGGGPAGYYKQHECTETVSVYRRGGLVVGPQGVNIKRIKEESGAMVQVIRETEEAVVSGSKERVDAAVAMVKELIASMPYKPHELAGAPPEIQALYPAGASHAGGGMMGGMGGMGGGAHESVEQVPCPFQAGAIIGPRGAVIREISEKTGARVVVRGNEAVTGGERVKGTEYVEIKGTPEAVANAVAEVNRILEEKAAMRGSGGGGGGYGHGGFEGHGHMDQNSYRAPPPGGYHDPYAAYGVPPPGAYAAHGAMPHGAYGGYGMPPHMPMGIPAAGGAWGHDPFAGAKQAAAAYDQGAHYAVPGAGDVGEVPPPPPPPPMGGGGDVGFVPSAADVGAPPPPPPPPA